MTAKIIYEGQLHTQATHVKSGNVLVTDAPTDNNGKGEAFSPTDLVATALGTCMLTVMGIAARKNSIDMEGATADVLKTMDSNPRRISRLDVRIVMPPKNYSDAEKEILTSVARSCPVCNSLSDDLKTAVEIVW